MNITCMNEIITIIAQIPGRSQGVLFFQNEIGERLGRIVMDSSFINSFSCKKHTNNAKMLFAAILKQVGQQKQ